PEAGGGPPCAAASGRITATTQRVVATPVGGDVLDRTEDRVEGGRAAVDRPPRGRSGRRPRGDVGRCDCHSRSTGSHSSVVAVLKSSARSMIDTIDGPGRSRQGFAGNHSAAVAAHVSCRAAGYGPDVVKTAQEPASTAMTSRSSGTSAVAETATPCRYVSSLPSR